MRVVRRKQAGQHLLVGTKLDADYFAMHVLRDYQDYKYHVADIEAKILQDIRS